MGGEGTTAWSERPLRKQEKDELQQGGERGQRQGTRRVGRRATRTAGWP